MLNIHSGGQLRENIAEITHRKAPFPCLQYCLYSTFYSSKSIIEDLVIYTGNPDWMRGYTISGQTAYIIS